MNEANSASACLSRAKAQSCDCCLQMVHELSGIVHLSACPMCGWIIDAFQSANPYISAGTNKSSLFAARLLWQRQQFAAQASSGTPTDLCERIAAGA